MKLTLILITSFFIAYSASASDHRHTLEITESWARATPPGISTSAIYMTVSNPTKNTVMVTGVTSTISNQIELHQTTNSDGLMKMRQIEAIEIAADSVIVLKPHGTHLMIFDLKEGLSEGSKIFIELILDSGKTIPHEVPVQMSMQGENADMQKHEHGIKTQEKVELHNLKND